MKYFLTVFIAASALIQTVVAQTPILLPSATVNADQRVKGLTYDSTINGQSVSFSFTYSLPSGYSATGANWWVDPTVNSTIAGTGSSFTYKAIGVGKHTITVKVMTNKGILNGSTTIAAIGGPLQYGVIGAETMSNSCDQVPTHDDDLISKPFHLQYFGYTDTVPSDVQYNQRGTVVLPTQLTGTTFTVTVTGPTTLPATMTYTGAVGMVVVPTNGSGAGAIKVRTTYTYTDPTDATLTGSATDDSEQTPPPGYTQTYPDYYSFTSHKPASIDVDDSEWYWYWALDYSWSYVCRLETMILTDQNGNGQPGVWVNERFVNLSSTLTNWSNATGQSSAFSVNTASDYWTTCRANGNPGWFHDYDQLSFEFYANALYPNLFAVDEYGLSIMPPLSLTQQYWAATKSVTAGGNGMHLATYLMRFTPISVEHIKQ